MKIEKVFDAIVAVVVTAIAAWTLVSGSGFDSRHATAVVVYFIVLNALIVKIFGHKKETAISGLKDYIRYQAPSGTLTVTIDIDVLEK